VIFPARSSNLQWPVIRFSFTYLYRVALWWILISWQKF